MAIDGALEKQPRVLFYFIPGNPGCVAYYDDFFSALERHLDRIQCPIHIHGRDLAGFEDDAHPPFSPTNPPFDVEAQIQHVHKNLTALQERNAYDFVILCGHSLGSYIALEVFHRHLRRSNPRLNLRAGILLFPAVTHISESPSGRRLSALLAVPLLGSVAHLVAKSFLFFWPAWALRHAVSWFTGFPPKATDVTVNFLKSRDGVWQAIHMGQDEMRTIGEDKWDEALWEMPGNATAPKFFFFFGQNDHWVSDHFRSNFIRAREKHIENGWTRIEIDDSGLPHSFCVTKENSEVVAAKAADWVQEICDTS